MFRILSLDGGGIKGAFTASVLAQLEEDTQCAAVEHFDLITGTSTGGIIAIGLGLGIPAREIIDFYRTRGLVIFPGTSLVRRVGGGLRRPSGPWSPWIRNGERGRAFPNNASAGSHEHPRPGISQLQPQQRPGSDCRLLHQPAAGMHPSPLASRWRISVGSSVWMRSRFSAGVRPLRSGASLPLCSSARAAVTALASRA